HASLCLVQAVFLGLRFCLLLPLSTSLSFIIIYLLICFPLYIVSLCVCGVWCLVCVCVCVCVCVFADWMFCAIVANASLTGEYRENNSSLVSTHTTLALFLSPHTHPHTHTHTHTHTQTHTHAGRGRSDCFLFLCIFPILDCPSSRTPGAVGSL